VTPSSTLPSTNFDNQKNFNEKEAAMLQCCTLQTASKNEKKVDS
jgi:hypothetical protein